MVNSTLVSGSCDDERSFHAQSPNKPLLLARQTAVTMRHPDQCGVNTFSEGSKGFKALDINPFLPLRIVFLYNSPSWAHRISTQKES